MEPERTSGAEIRVDGVSRAYRTPAGVVIPALRRVSMSAPTGSVLALTGPSGSGKSTLLHVIGCMDRADEGSVLVDGVDITRLSERRQVHYRRTVGFVFQRFHLLPAMTALDNVLAPVMPYRTPFVKRQRAMELLTLVGLDDRADALPSKLSGGQQQRVAIARALINSPTLMLADEPTGNLDSVTGDGILDLVLALNRERGMTVLVATHDRAVAERCERTLQLKDGELTSPGRAA